MKIKVIQIRETAGIERREEPVRTGIPFARGELFRPETLRLRDGAGNELPLQSRTLLRWPDGSCKWVLLDTLANVPPGGDCAFELFRADQPRQDAAMAVEAGAEYFTVDTGGARFLVNAREFSPFTEVFGPAGERRLSGAGRVELTGEGGEACRPRIERIGISEQGPVRTTLAVSGRFCGPAEEKARFRADLHFFRGKALVSVDFTLHNPGAARHAGGLWDLGDAGALLFRGLNLSLPVEPPSAASGCLTVAPGGAALHRADSLPLSIYQESSGGTQWQSPVHRDRTGSVPMRLKGYRATLGGATAAEGERARPVLWCGRGDRGTGVAVPRFWQEFPKALSLSDDRMEIGLWPAQFPGDHELQGGERKTHTFFIDFACASEDLLWVHEPLSASPAPEVFADSGAVPWLPRGKRSAEIPEPLAAVIDPGHFLAKREACDEYGWRHFGEVYADHEAVDHKGEEPFVSHYNNQYDPLFGFYRQFFATGDPGWGRLASELARHVIDIDIYHTDADREEYNRGLFWHTDHYLDAGRATHRSFSREHLTVKDPRFCGGGPGAEHCYTTGLFHHYLMTGEEQAREAVLGLADWVYRSLGGDETVLAALNRSRKNLNRWKSARHQPPPFPRFPLTRGTGNTITACLDAFELSGNRLYLRRCARLIRGTVHPRDDIDSRNLLNAETGWSYTVFLVALGKFLEKKFELGELDADFAYARKTLEHYADWMVSHEYPYLEKTEILEFPNETWAAQDLRKSVVFYYAGRFGRAGRSAIYRESAGRFFAAGCGELAKWPTRGLARPAILLLQNEWVGGALRKGFSPAADFADAAPVGGKPTPPLTLPALVCRSLLDLGRAVRKTSPGRELAWLRSRVRP